MKLIAAYIVFVLVGDVVAYIVGRSAEQWLPQSISLTIFLVCFFLVFGGAWILAVRVTEPRST